MSSKEKHARYCRKSRFIKRKLSLCRKTKTQTDGGVINSDVTQDEHSTHISNSSNNDAVDRTNYSTNATICGNVNSNFMGNLTCKSKPMAQIQENIISLPVKKSEELKLFLRSWTLEHRVNSKQLNSLLKGLGNIIPNMNLPKDRRSLLCTKRNFDILPLYTQKGSEGQYIYFGFDSGIKTLMENKTVENEIMKSSCINLLLNVDGVPLFKSDNKQFWPILCRLHVENHILSPFCVAIFCGNSKPLLPEYLVKMVEELNKLLKYGFKFNGTKYTVNIMAICCDAPARSFLKCVKNHNGRSACERCIQEGIYYKKRMVYLETNAEARTYNNFKSNAYHDHQLSRSPLLDLKNFDVIKKFPLDYMHLCLLGVMRKLLNYWMKGCETRKVRLPVHLRTKLCNRLQYFAKFVPSNFNRKGRTLVELDHFKATEFRLILLYLGPVIFKNILPNDLYEHFLLFHAAIRILCSPDLINTTLVLSAKEMLLGFVENFPRLYGKQSCIYNVHSLIHLADDVLNLKLTLDELSCFPFENYLGKLVRLIHRPYLPLSQVCSRLSENQNLNCQQLYKDNKFKLNRNLKELVAPEFTIRYNGNRDNYVFLKERNLVMEISEIHEDFSITGRVSSSLENLYDYPISSIILGVYKFKTFTHHSKFTVFDITGKAFVLNRATHSIAFKLLHLNL